MLATSGARKVRGFDDVRRCYDRNSLTAKLSFRTLRDATRCADRDCSVGASGSVRGTAKTVRGATCLFTPQILIEQALPNHDVSLASA